MANKANTPAIRFKGFTDAWEQRELGDCGETYSGLSGKSKRDFGHGDGKYITYMNVFANAVCNPSTTESVEIDTKQNTVQTGDVFFTTSSETPEEVGMSSVLVEHIDNTYLNSFCFGYRPSIKFDNYYLAYMLRSDGVRKNISFLAQGISRYNISKTKMLDIKISIPKLIEQKEIGELFRTLDHLITLHQRKLSKMKNIKKAMLEKMFPKEGCDVPEIRFGGFTDAWEQRKLRDLVSRITRKNLNYESTLPLTISAQYGLVDQITYFRSRVASRDVRNYYLIFNGEFAYNKSTSEGFPFGAVKRLDLYDDGVLSTLYIVFSIMDFKKCDSDFLTVFFDTDRWHRGISERAAEGARNHGLLNISADDFLDISIRIPKNINEQKQIGDSFQQLDHLITLYQRKLEKLQNIKKSLLEKMFV